MAELEATVRAAGDLVIDAEEIASAVKRSGIAAREKFTSIVGKFMRTMRSTELARKADEDFRNAR